VIDGADLFLGLSGPGVLTPEMVARMASRPIVFALANPTPEIMPDAARAVAPDAIIATGRSDYPNQVNNVLCFPFIFRGALDVGATEINDAMQIACIEGIAALARATTSAEAAAAYRGEQMTFGADYLIPKPFDPRLMGIVASAVAAGGDGNGRGDPADRGHDAYKARLDGSVFRSALIMRPVFEAARAASRRIVFAEGEDERVLRAAHAILEETTEVPILIGRPEVIAMRCERAGLPIRPKPISTSSTPRTTRATANTGKPITADGTRGVTPDIARAVLRTNTTAIGAVMVHRGEADSLICGTFGQYLWHLNYVTPGPGPRRAAARGALSLMIQPEGRCSSPTRRSTRTHARADRRDRRRCRAPCPPLRHHPKVALCSHSQFGNLDTTAAGGCARR
jgi:malate dehydrogenase (oxaloacetate-decarboxylating)(NADP+)